MIKLLEGETVLGDLYRGPIQQVTSDIFLNKTLLLTNRRLIVNDRRLGSFVKRHIFLGDVTSVESRHVFDIAAASAAAICGFFALLLIGAWIADKNGVPLFLGLVCVAGGVILWLMTRRNAIIVSTMTADFEFALHRSFSPERADEFVELVQQHVGAAK